MISVRKKNIRKIDKTLLATFIILLCFGLIVLNSASLSLDRNLLPGQLAATAIGLIISLFLLALDLELIKKLYIPIYIFSLILLSLSFFFGVGQTEWGANAWVSVAGVTFQASEIAKIGLIIFFATYLDNNKKTINKPTVFGKLLILAIIPIAMVLKQPDAGTAMVMVFIIIVMLFTAGFHVKYFIAAFVTGIASLPFVYMRLDEFQKNRILNFIHPERDVSDTGYQAMQSKIAIGSGRFAGKGLNHGIQTQYNFIPEKQTDFIFAVLVEELGFLGGTLLILLYGVMIYRFVKVASETTSFYSKLIIMGITAMFLFHIFENIGMSIGLMPITGIPLPFFSHGGTFQITNILCIALVLSASIQREPLSFQ